MIHCCAYMPSHTEKGIELEYDPGMLGYYLILGRDEDNCTHQEIGYCPWCGTRLPQNLNDAWSQILKDEYGIKDPLFTEKIKVPPEFQSDEWWRKRGL